MKRNTLFIALAALGVALAPAGRLTAQTPAAHAHHGSHATSGGAHGGHARHGDHALTPAMLLRHRADLGLTEAQVGRLQGLGADDAAGARAVLTPEQKTRLAQLHRSATAGHSAHHSGGDHGDCCKDGECCCEGEDCCRDGECRHEECCRDGDCCCDKDCCRD
ncbi:MAG TPA: hypothetical protein VHG28_13475, partial [Longimicrobiaceae bacterium]|nr:hypothetical protein [Longimicrobiaceae bacterium]